MVKKLEKKANKSSDFQPTKMGVAVAAMAAASLVLFGVVAMSF